MQYTIPALGARAKLAATEGAQQVIDAAVQLFGGLGVTRGQIVEQLYRAATLLQGRAYHK